jgi:hypothetical protein
VGKKSTAADVVETDDPVLTMSECARRASKSPQTIRRWIIDGLLKAVRHPSGIPGVRQSEFERFYGNSALAGMR